MLASGFRWLWQHALLFGIGRMAVLGREAGLRSGSRYLASRYAAFVFTWVPRVAFCTCILLSLSSAIIVTIRTMRKLTQERILYSIGKLRLRQEGTLRLKQERTQYSVAMLRLRQGGTLQYSIATLRLRQEGTLQMFLNDIVITSVNLS